MAVIWPLLGISFNTQNLFKLQPNKLAVSDLALGNVKCKKRFLLTKHLKNLILFSCKLNTIIVIYTIYP